MLVDSADTDGDGEISFVEFVILLAGRGTKTQQFVNQQMVQMRDAFRMFDKDGAPRFNIKLDRSDTLW